MGNKYKILINLLLFFILVSCDFSLPRQNENQELPILSPKIDGAYKAISSFQFVNNYNQTITQNDVKSRVYVAEFFFTSCTAICPIVSKQLLRVFKEYKDEPNFMILSHTVDPKHDTVEKLKLYYQDVLEINKPSNWHLLTGDKEDIYNLANFSYGAVVYEDLDKLSDNIMHSGALVLLDQNGLIRGMYDGKDQESTNRLIRDIRLLL